jgi:DNA polymerase-3 subunit epsilon
MKNLLIIDTETDSTNPDLANILELALARLDLETGQVDIVFDSLILPDRPYLPGELEECWWMQHSHVPVSFIQTALKFSEVRNDFAAILAVAPVTAYNLYYDRRVLRRHGLPIENVWPCLMQTCTPILKLPGHYHNPFPSHYGPDDYGDYKYPKFTEAWNYFFPDLPFVERHRAAWDALHEAKLAYRLYRDGYLEVAKKCQ